jgi:VCBS repeat-containing protein
MDYSTLFSIDNAGQVTLLQALDFEEAESYAFGVSVEDGEHTTTETVTFTVENVNDPTTSRNTSSWTSYSPPSTKLWMPRCC